MDASPPVTEACMLKINAVEALPLASAAATRT
jgi:hypothetical protein